MTALAVAERAKIKNSNLSRLLSSDQRPTHETARAIVANLPHNRAEAEELAWAYLADEREAVGAADLVSISPASDCDTCACADLSAAMRATLGEIDAIADSAADAAARAALVRRRLATAAGMSSPLSYDDGRALGMVAEAPKTYANGRKTRPRKA